MDKQTLTSLLQENEFAYAVLREKTDASTVSFQWGSGALAPYFLKPYAAEFLGSSRGKMLKNPSKPGRNRYRYSLDSAGRIICGVAYTSLGGTRGNESWIHDDDFYEYHSDHIIQLRFSGVSGDTSNTRLSAVTWATLKDGKVVKSCTLGRSSFSHYTEQAYVYDHGLLVSMQLRWPDGPYPDRNFRVFHEGQLIRIMELAAGNNQEGIQIYPPE